MRQQAEEIARNRAEHFARFDEDEEESTPAVVEYEERADEDAEQESWPGNNNRKNNNKHAYAGELNSITHLRALFIPREPYW
jgi:hypothetical protein